MERLSKGKRIAYAAFGAVALLVLAFAGLAKGLIPGGPEGEHGYILVVGIPLGYVIDVFLHVVAPQAGESAS